MKVSPDFSFKPRLATLFFFFLFCFIAYAASIQSWVFTEGVAKPYLYDVLEPFPFWPTWVYLLLPLFWGLILFFNFGLVLLLLLFTSLSSFDTFFHSSFLPEWLFQIVQVVYFYILSCFFVFLRKEVNKEY